jgi:hypothetical protein
MERLELGKNMINCLLCEKKFETQKGLSSHLARVHDIRDQKRKFSLYIIADFFPLIEKRSWTKTETLLQQIKQEKNNNEWMRGYILALEGMVSALKEEGTHTPYIFSLKDSSYTKLQEEKRNFSEFNKTLALKNDFDAAYFQAWTDYTYYLMNSKI